MNRITPIILVGCIFSVWAAEDKIYPPTTNIFSGIASPSAQAVASPKSAPAVSHANQTSDTKPLTAEELKLKKELEESSAAASAAVASLSQSASAAQKLLESTPTLQLYTQDELNNLIAEHQHLKRVKDEQCQLVHARQGEPGIVEYAYVEGGNQHARFFSQAIRLGVSGIEEVLDYGSLSQFEQSQLESMLPTLRDEIQLGLDFAKQ